MLSLNCITILFVWCYCYSHFMDEEAVVGHMVKLTGTPNWEVACRHPLTRANYSPNSQCSPLRGYQGPTSKASCESQWSGKCPPQCLLTHWFDFRDSVSLFTLLLLNGNLYRLSAFLHLHCLYLQKEQSTTRTHITQRNIHHIHTLHTQYAHIHIIHTHTHTLCISSSW